MDIEYLLLLQNLREGVFGGCLDDFANMLSDFIISPWPLMIGAFVFWIVNKRAGCYFFMNYAFTKLVNEVIKLSCCIYRPWIRDARVLPAGNSKVTATGYSFPSGHSNLAVSTYGTLAVWQWRARRWISIISIILLLMTLFSRNFLGVHTPEDVIIGSLTSVLMMFLNYRLFKYFEKENKEIHRLLVLIPTGIAIVILFYINFKAYPHDYIDGNLIVDPQKMLPDCYEALGMFMGFIFGWFIERHCINFNVPKKDIVTVVIAIIATIPIYFIQKNSGMVISPFVGDAWAKFIVKFIEYIYIFTAIPLIYNLVTIRKIKNPSDRGNIEIKRIIKD